MAPVLMPAVEMLRTFMACLKQRGCKRLVLHFHSLLLGWQQLLLVFATTLLLLGGVLAGLGYLFWRVF